MTYKGRLRKTRSVLSKEDLEEYTVTVSSTSKTVIIYTERDIHMMSYVLKVRQKSLNFNTDDLGSILEQSYLILRIAETP